MFIRWQTYINLKCIYHKIIFLVQQLIVITFVVIYMYVFVETILVVDGDFVKSCSFQGSTFVVITLVREGLSTRRKLPALTCIK